MKSVLIAINVMLAILAAGEVIKCLSIKNDIASARETTTVKKAKDTSRPLVSIPEKASPITPAIQRSPQQIEEQVNLISALNIFSPDRTPEIPTAAKRMAANNASAEKKLVGTFEINGTKGAIILQRTNQRNGNRNAFGFDGGFGFGGFGFGDMGFGMDRSAANQNNNTSQASAEEVSQAQIEDARQRLAQLQSVMQTLQRNNATADQLASITRQIEAQNTLLQQLLAIATPQDAEEDGVASISATNSNNVRQYLRLGDSTSDGYMLIDVTRTTATLRRNNDVIELTIQKASENQEAMALAASRVSAAQVVVSDTPANTSSNTVASSNGGGRRNNGGFGDFGGGFGGGDFGGFGGGDFGGFGGGDGGFGGFGGGNGGFGGGNNGFGGGNGGFGGGNNNSRANSMTGGNRAGMTSNSRTTTNSASSRNNSTRNNFNSNTAGRTNNTTRTNTNSATRTNTNSNTMRNNMNTGRTNSNASRNNAAGRTGVNTGNRGGGAGMGGR